GEFDLADRVRDLDLRPHREPLRLAILALLALLGPFRRRVELFLQLLVVPARLAHGVDLLLDLTAPLLDALVGDLLVVEDHELADRALAGVQRVAELDHLLGDERRARDRLDHRELAALDAPRDLDLALARE